MTLPREEFDKFHPEEDPYYNEVPVLKLDDLYPRSHKLPVISVMISTWNRYSQLARSLECYARQTFKDFEILLNDDGSTQNIKGLVEKFSPYLNIKYYYTPRDSWVSCGSRAYKKMLPDAQGRIICATHPEMMLTFDALQFVYDILMGDGRTDVSTYVVGNPEYIYKPDMLKWVSFRANFFGDYYKTIDKTKWHSSLDIFHTLHAWENNVGFAAQNNTWHSNRVEYPWWFFGAALKECPIWNDFPVFVGHAGLDMWFIKYRTVNNILDVVPNKVMCYHQPHVTSAISPEGEIEDARVGEHKIIGGPGV